MGFVVLAVVLVVLLLLMLPRGRRGRPAMRVIGRPVLGIVALGGSHQGDVARDRERLAPLFVEVREGAGELPLCDVLLLYAALAEDGSLAGDERTLVEVLQGTGATVAVVASDNTAEAYQAALRRPPRINLVLALERKGPALAELFAQLFERMRAGESMPLVWNRLATGAEESSQPETVFLCGAGQVTFG